MPLARWGVEQDRRTATDRQNPLTEHSMRKRLIALAAATLLTLGAPNAEAQQQTQLTMSTWRALTNNNGGGWNATSTIGLGSDDLTSFIVYCFDDKRFFSSGRTYSYYALTFEQFLNGTGAGPGGRPTNWNTVVRTDLNTMVGLINGDVGTGYVLDNAGAKASNSSIQQQLWNLGNDVVQGSYGAGSYDYDGSWMVLVDKAEWDRGLTGQRGFQGSQSFLAQIPTRVPEPSSYALLASGLAGLGFMARRKRIRER
jgi:PEP-CTERM motif